jgi:hypothetical protein
MGLQSHRSPKFRNFGTFNLGVPRQNDIWMQAPWPSIENIIKGKVVASPSLGHVEFYESMFARGLFVHQKCFNYTLTNLLFGLCKSVWIIDLLIIHPSPHPGALARPFTLEVLWAKERTPIHYPFVVFTLGLAVDSIKEFEGVSVDSKV